MRTSNAFCPIPTARWLACALLLIGLCAGTAQAQLQTGNLYGEVADAEGARLPGVTVTIRGNGAPQFQLTDASGAFRFLGLSPGTYQLTAELEGFSTVDYPSISITTGRSTTIEVTLTAALEDVITVTSESPLLDQRKITTGTSVSQVELEKIPTARDPWVILQQTPGVLVDRVNVGGNESGQQSAYISPGTSADNGVWAVDGVVITDMGAIGSSPSYYNFDAFEEMQVTTGGTDVSLATGGVTMNMVTKRGTNEWRASGRYLWTDESTQSSLDFDQDDLGAGQNDFEQGNQIVDVLDYGADAGGPLVKDRLWIWGTYGVQEIDLLTLDDVSDFTELESYAAKLNAQLTPSNSAIAFYHYGDKVKIGRNAGPTRPQPTTWNQTGPTDIYKLEDTHIFSSSFYLTGMASYVGGGFALAPQGGGIGDPSFPSVVRDPDGVWRNSFRALETVRPQDQYKLDGSYFFNTGGASHELRFGVSYREAQVDSFSAWPGPQLVGLADIAFGPDQYLGFSRTDRNVSDTVEYTSLYVQDTLSFGNLTANVGLRYDQQEGTNNAKSIPAAPVNQGLLTGGSFAGGDPGFEWASIEPRLGLTYALGEERKTLLRASYSRFADQLASGVVSTTNPTNYQYGYFTWYDSNRDLQLTTDEVGPFFDFNGAVDPNRPGQLINLAQVDPDLDAPITEELILSVEHALLPEFVIGGSVTVRNYSDILNTERLVTENGATRRHVRSDYVLGEVVSDTLPNGQLGTGDLYVLRPGVTFNNETILTNSGREQDYLGISLTFNKRLANRWLLRGHVTWSDWEWDIPDSEIEDPTSTLPGGNIDGGAVLIGSGTGSGAKGDVFINSNWAFDVSGLYQIAPDRPWGFNVAANINGREGYPNPYAFNRNPGDGIGTRAVLLVDDVERFRNDDLIIFNARIEKELTFNDLGVTLSLDAFNLTNESTVLQRETTLSFGSGDFVREITSPRIFRFGARFSFR